MENLPILYQNVMSGMSPFARDVFLWAVERPDEDRYCYRAEEFAHEADLLRGSCGHLIRLSEENEFVRQTLGEGHRAILDEATAGDLLSFILTRHANWRYGGNVKPPYVSRR